MISPDSMDDVGETLIVSPNASLLPDLTLAEARATLIYLDNAAAAADVRIKKIGDAKRAIKRVLLGEEKATRG